MSSWAKPGVKCVCVDPNPAWPSFVSIETPVKGGIYTIRAIVDVDAVLLEEVRNKDCLVHYTFGIGVGEPCFGIWRFRPLVTKTQQEDVELFRHLLTSTEERV